MSDASLVHEVKITPSLEFHSFTYKMRVAIIGCGASGLTAIKTCKEYELDVVCYERSDDIGGLWRYRDEDEEGLASVAKSTIINSSKEITAYSDFPPPEEFSSYMHNSMMFRYLQMYAEKFDLVRHIKFKHRVEEITQADDYDSTGRWKVKTTDKQNGKEIEEIVDAVMVCTGHHVFPYVPTFPGQEKFRGRIIHTHSYKKPHEYEDKRVVVVGVGNSGGDAAVETSTIAKKVYLSTRRGCWITHKVGENGIPNDEQMLNRVINILLHVLPFDSCCWYFERRQNRKFDHETYQLKPKHRILQQQPTTNDLLPYRILSGTIAVKGSIKRFEENGILFEGDNEITEVDEVILATGYEIKFPFISKDILSTGGNHVELFKYVFPPSLKHPTLGIIGLLQSAGGFFPLFEIQSRWFVELLTKKIPFQTEEEMRENIQLKLEENRKRYYNSLRHAMQVGYIDYLDEVSSLFGAKPNFLKMFFTDQTLFWALMLGPSLPYQYRLQGPHSWPQARDAILRYQERLHAPLKTRFKDDNEKSKDYYSIPRLLLFAFVLLAFVLFCL